MGDRGGLLFNPPLGYHEDVAELDFVSMYPTIMVEHNVSPETINCRCCSNRRVPELGYTVCRSEEHTSELQSQFHLVCRLLLEKNITINYYAAFCARFRPPNAQAPILGPL